MGSAAPGDDTLCQKAVAKRVRNIAKQQQKKNRKCVQDGSGDISTCISFEADKAAIQRGKLVDLFAAGGKCETSAGLGVHSDPNGIADLTENGAGDILRGAFGDPVDGIEAGSTCQDKIVKWAGTKFYAELNAFRRCVKDAAPLASQAALNGCITAGVNDPLAQTTVQPSLAPLLTQLCDLTGGQPVGMDDGDCAACGTGPTCAECLGDLVDCRACLAMNNSTNGTANCDLLDDGEANSSCCPLAAGEYTFNSVAGGAMRFFNFNPFPFPSGGTLIQDVAAASAPGCVHNTVIPAANGFFSPAFCIPALNFIGRVTQTGCGIGLIDSDGGSDFRISELDDTSDSSATCMLPHAACTNGADASSRADVTVGDGLADVCAGTGIANAIAVVPVHTRVWADTSAGTFGGCQGDGIFNAGDVSLLEYDHILDLTTDEAHSSWTDIDGDGCHLAGFGPEAGQPSVKGECLDTNNRTVTLVAAGGFGSTEGPQYDGSFSITLPNTVAMTHTLIGQVCASPPPITFTGGTATRCMP
jgi:hypothetical protein